MLPQSQGEIAPMQRSALVLAILLFAMPAAAQQYWLPNGPGGTTYNNPNGSLLGTMNEHLLQRHMQQRQFQNGQAAPSGKPAAAPQAASGADPSFRLTNAGARTVRELYVSASRDSAWGADRLGAEVLAPGSRVVIRLPAGQCVNDIRVVFTDGQAQERRNLDTCALTDMTVR
jgi:hypothetical protein